MSMLMMSIEVILILFVSCCVFIWMLAVKSQSPSRKPLLRKPAHAFEEVSFKGTAQLYGWLIWPSAAREQRSPAIIVSHGWGSNRSRVLRYADRLAEEGYAVLVYDVTSHGESEGVKAPSALLFRDDLKAAVQYLRSREDIDADHIGVLGHSLGGFGALLALDEGLPVRAIVTDSMPAHPLMMVSAELKRHKLPSFMLAGLIPRIWLMRAGIPHAEYNAVDFAATLERNQRREADRVAILMSHSSGDTYIPSSEMMNTIHKLTYDQPYVLVDTPGHSCSEQDERFWETVMPFYKQHVPLMTGPATSS